MRDYTIIGLLATATHYSVLLLLVDVLHLLDPVRASAIGFLSGAVVSFLLNNKVVFKQSAITLAALGKYILLIMINSVTNTLLMYVLVNIISMQYLLAQCVVTFLLYLSNFMICKIWVFNERVYAEQS